MTIVTSLLAAYTGFYTSYAGSKAPVEHFTRGVSKELMGKRVSVNAIAPGPMDTRKSLVTLPLQMEIF
jgi:NAD(P)-dependent dehydrogenase (short-subunit alcohol dehydrogenase family)